MVVIITLGKYYTSPVRDSLSLAVDLQKIMVYLIALISCSNFRENFCYSKDPYAFPLALGRKCSG